MKNRTQDQEIFAALMAPILAKFKLRLSQTSHKYKHFQAKLLLNDLSIEACEAIMAEAHKVAGSASTLGFKELGASAAEVEGYIRGILILKDFENGRVTLTPVFDNFLSNVNKILVGYTEEIEVSSLKTNPLVEPEFHVLIVDDDEFARDLVKTSLRNDSCSISEAATGSEALSLFESQRPDMVVLDVNLPDISGFAVLETIRSQSSGGKVPIVMLSREDSIENILLGRAGGATKYLTKPISIQKLEMHFRDFLRSTDRLRTQN